MGSTSGLLEEMFTARGSRRLISVGKRGHPQMTPMDADFRNPLIPDLICVHRRHLRMSPSPAEPSAKALRESDAIVGATLTPALFRRGRVAETDSAPGQVG